MVAFLLVIFCTSYTPLCKTQNFAELYLFAELVIQHLSCPAWEHFILYHCVFNFQLKNLTEFVHLVQEGVELAQLLRVNLSFTNHLQNKTKWERNKIYLREMWKNLGPIICGPDPDAQPKKKVIDHMYDYRCRTKACKTRAMRLMLYLLLHNPKIAYSPNGTAADEIIKKVT